MIEKSTANGVQSPEAALEDFGGRLTEAMKAAEHTQRTLAPRIGAHYNSVGQWARGKRWPDIEHLAPVAVELNVSVDWLLTGREPASARRGAVPANERAVQLAREFSDLAPALSKLARRAKKLAAGA